MTTIHDDLVAAVGPRHVLQGEAIGHDYTHDESISRHSARPGFVVKPASTGEVADVVAAAVRHRVPLTARGSGTGLSGACVPSAGGILLSLERMNRIVEIDLVNHVAVVEPGVTLDQLDRALAEVGLVYPVFPGENSASLGGNVATNAGGMRAVKYGVTRHHVLGLTAVLGTGEIVETGGKFVKETTGYDLTQLIIGSEGTLAVVTQAVLKLHPRLSHSSTLLVPFATLEQVTAAVPEVVASGVGPLIVEYIDMLTMAAMVGDSGLELGVPAQITETALAYLVVVLEDRRADRLDEDIEEMAGRLADLGALDVYVLPSSAGTQLIGARERALFAAKARGTNDIIDVVVPRGSIAPYMAKVAELAARSGSFVAGCGHAGDGNVHMSVFQPDPEVRHTLMRDIFAAGMELGGAISAEHGIGVEKKAYLQELENPAKLALMRRIKQAFDPAGILNPGVIFDPDPDPDPEPDPNPTRTPEATE